MYNVATCKIHQWQKVNDFVYSFFKERIEKNKSNWFFFLTTSSYSSVMNSTYLHFSNTAYTLLICMVVISAPVLTHCPKWVQDLCLFHLGFPVKKENNASIMVQLHSVDVPKICWENKCRQTSEMFITMLLTWKKMLRNTYKSPTSENAVLLGWPKYKNTRKCVLL